MAPINGCKEAVHLGQELVMSFELSPMTAMGYDNQAGLSRTRSSALGRLWRHQPVLGTMKE
ncbi:hypothetical protein CN97_05285 [Haematobacter massiliensis]|uniref:Uncharacterized protein n=1 Tax=Haematobacter massiliensis TaxID=195105 RepID=A0A086YD73_9RHOB|nr:hypothetical protein CN97_05285 [Haematobacter massiliensis]